MKLGIPLIVSKGLDLVNREGLDGLNLRALANDLQVKPSALYWHVAGKKEIVSHMAATFYQAAYENAQGEDWPDWLKSYGCALHDILTRQRDSAQICAKAIPLENDEGRVARFATPLTARGLPSDAARLFQASVVSYTLGWVVFEQKRVSHGQLEQLFDSKESFERGLVAIIAGFARECGNR